MTLDQYDDTDYRFDICQLFENVYQYGQGNVGPFVY